MAQELENHMSRQIRCYPCTNIELRVDLYEVKADYIHMPGNGDQRVSA